ncbi:THAP domain-containing protein 5-like [Scleropages formosus]|uniref:THAP domain-containing protein 5-like n=1 Tax=Scleropages formosus TaxID=113540 RepID=UPI000878BAD8|nr:THAP domain-containing protein 5 [Scleropages formosus]
MRSELLFIVSSFEMPRYCAVKLCKNRGGGLSKDNKKISFYPFPLRDEARLRKWVDNMERKEWSPSRHQYLCSEHFTEDSFDLRWGIRYLKHTAVPTIFPFIYDTGESPNIQDELKKLNSKKNSKTKPGVNAKSNRSSSPVKRTVLPLKKETLSREEDIHLAEGALTSEPGVEGPQLPAVMVLSDSDPAGSSSHKVVHPQVLPPGFVEPASRQPDEEALIDSGLSMPSEAQQFPSSAPSPPSGSSDRLQAASSRTESAPPSAACGEDLQGAPSSVERSLLEEHSYSRQDMDKNQLWNKIASLHMKIMELEKREEGTIAKINSLENTIVHLRKENIVSEEKQKALEGYFTTVFL